METQKDRLCRFISYIGVTNNRFEKNILAPTGTISHMKDRISNNVMEKIIKAYPQLNTMWLMTGDGEMLLPPSGASIDVDMSSGKHVHSPHTEISGNAAAAAAMQAKIDALEAQVQSLEADKVKLMNLLDKCIGK